MTEQSQMLPKPTPPVAGFESFGRTIDRLYKTAVVILTTLVVIGVVIVVGRAAVYKIHEYERGLHLRGGRFIGVQTPGWHMQIPLVDTVIIVRVSERLGYVEQIPAMTSDNVTMLVSLQYTYRVTDPEQYALQVDDPERIVFEFVQGRLRDVVNTKAMTEVMNNRTLMNTEVMDVLREKEEQYGVEFVTVQMQNASPPTEVLTAIKDRMVAVQRQEQAMAEAVQSKTLADANYYAAQKQADAEAYQITTTAQAEAERMRLEAEAKQTAVGNLVAALANQGALGEKMIQYLIAQELKDNSKWIIPGDSTPMIDMRSAAE
jgi:membrane protease subunit HflK